jgi:hypothetical protein
MSASVKAKGKLSKEARENTAILKGLHDSMPMPLDELREHQSNLLIAARKRAEKKAAAPKKKADATPDPLKPLTDSLREYERVSYFLATVKDFNFKSDDEAQRFFHTFDPSNAFHIDKLTQDRVNSYGKPIQKGTTYKGLALRTNERMKRNAKPKKKGA